AGAPEGVVHGVVLGKAGGAWRATIKRGAVTGAAIGAGALPLERGDALPVRRIFDDAKGRPVLGRHEPKSMVGRLGIAAVVGGHRPRLPPFRPHPAAPVAPVNLPRPPLPRRHRAARAG